VADLIPGSDRRAPNAPSWTPDRTTLALLLAAIAFGAAFLAVAALATGPVTPPVEASLIAFARGLPVGQDAWLAITDLGAGPVLLVVGGIVILGLIARGQPRAAVLVGAALVVVTVGVDVLKEVTARPRRDDALVLTSGLSFPSGHALNGTVAWGLLALLAWRSELARPVRQGLVAAMVAVVVLVGLSRITLGAHYPTDVLAGWLGGLAVLAVVAVVARTPPGGGGDSRRRR
jgi:membrane-associated phospholipid phosphatase